MTVPRSDSEPNEFLAEEMQREADEALNAALTPAPVPPMPEDEKALFQAHMRRFPGQRE